jgi:hypothetical protein
MECSWLIKIRLYMWEILRYYYTYYTQTFAFDRPSLTTSTTQRPKPRLQRHQHSIEHHLPKMDAGWEELERMTMAASAADAQIADEYPSPDTIERWKRLFGYSHMEAVRLIGDQRGDGKSLLLEAITD